MLKNLKIVDDKNGNVLFSRVCSVTQREYSVEITKKEFYDWKVNGGMIQDVLSRLDISQREFLISGFTPAEWDETFGIYEAL